MLRSSGSTGVVPLTSPCMPDACLRPSARFHHRSGPVASPRRRASAPRRCTAASRPRPALDLTSWPPTRQRLGRGDLHDEPGAGRAGAGLEAPSRSEHGGPRHRREQRLRQRLHRRPGHARRRSHGGRSGGRPGLQPEHVLVASTGVIGVNLQMDKVVTGIHAAGGARPRQGQRDGAGHHDDRPVSEGMRGRVQTAAAPSRRRHGKGLGHDRAEHGDDARLPDDRCGGAAGAAPPALQESARDTFNAITVDGEGSTNDSLFALASGASGVTIDERLLPGAARGAARRVARSGARHRPRRRGRDQADRGHRHDARSRDDARQVARTIANSPLVKTAVHGADPNWGRIVAAAGRSGRDLRHRSRHGARRRHPAVRERPAA